MPLNCAILGVSINKSGPARLHPPGPWLNLSRRLSVSSIPLSKLCTKCGRDLPLEQYFKRSGSSDGRTSHCKECKKAWADDRKQKPKIVVAEKTCTRCRQSLSPGDFHKDANRVDGLSPWCKECAIENARSYYYDNHEQQLEYRRQYAAENRDAAKERARRWISENRDRHRANGQVWQHNNRDKVAKINRRWRQANPQKQVQYTQNHNALKANAEGTHTAEQFRALVEYYGDKCLCCGEVRPFTVDHVIALSNGGANDISNIQPLCGPCNYSKAAWHNTDYRPDGGEFARQLAQES